MAEFVTGKALDDAICDLIVNSKETLVILSPFIKLEGYFRKLFVKHKSNAQLQIIIGFGKNENDPSKSFNKEDFEFFKEFPNISIVYIPNLHAKYYANESSGVLSSINLYDYSFRNNVEYGILLKSSLMGVNSLDQQAWKYTMELLYRESAVFVRRPLYKKGMLGLVRNYTGSEDKLDQTELLISGKKLKEIGLKHFDDVEYTNVRHEERRQTREEYDKNEKVLEPSIKYKKVDMTMLSATALGKLKNMSYKEVIKYMEQKGYILGDTITKNGIEIGLKYKEAKDGSQYITYPEDLKNDM